MVDEMSKIIADLGSNWKTKDELKNSIHLAKCAGADIIKFQSFCEKDLYGFGSTEYNLEPHLWRWLKEECDKKGIEFMCTVFNPELIPLLDEYVDRFKVSSGDMCYVKMLDAIRETGKPVIISTGSHHKNDIEMTIKHMTNDWQGQIKIDYDITLMYCVAAYPANKAHLPLMLVMKRKFGHKVGFSDHTTSALTIPRMACRVCDAEYLEKHFNPFDYKDTPDAPHSLNLDDFRLMVDNIKGRYTPGIGQTPEEKDMITKHNRRAIAIKDIKPGDHLIYGKNYGYYRSKVEDVEGMHCFRNIEGACSNKAFKQGQGINLI
jgi:sialic acid synthase SpsE